MAEYIEREDLIKKVSSVSVQMLGIRAGKSLLREAMKIYKETFIKCVEEAPSADVVEVVRKPIKAYEGYYEVDPFGRVYSVDRIVPVEDNGRNYNKPLKGKQMKQSLHTKGYKTVSLTKDGKTKTCYVHRIVAEAFIDNPDNLPFINHKDEDKTNNFVDNLEWCTNEYNLNYGTARKRQSRALKGKKHTQEHNEKISKGVKSYFCSYGKRKEGAEE